LPFRSSFCRRLQRGVAGSGKEEDASKRYLRLPQMEKKVGEIEELIIHYLGEDKTIDTFAASNE
jgi:hypothetical protein